MLWSRRRRRRRRRTKRGRRECSGSCSWVWLRRRQSADWPTAEMKMLLPPWAREDFLKDAFKSPVCPSMSLSLSLSALRGLDSVQRVLFTVFSERQGRSSWSHNITVSQRLGSTHTPCVCLWLRGAAWPKSQQRGKGASLWFPGGHSQQDLMWKIWWHHGHTEHRLFQSESFDIERFLQTNDAFA